MTGWVLRIILIILIVRALWRLAKGVLNGVQGTSAGGPRGRGAPVALSRDPICGTYVVPSRALPLRDGALVRYFCSERCRDQYARSPRTDS
jgi:YHS domain-containing protein